MRKTIITAALLMVLSTTMALSQAIPPTDGVPTIAEIVAEVTPAVPPAEWTAAVAETAPVVDVPAPPTPPAALAEPPARSDADSFRAWAEQEVQAAPKIKFINEERNELLVRMEARQIFIYTPRNELGMPMIPEPSSILALAVGLSGMVATIHQRRRTR